MMKGTAIEGSVSKKKKMVSQQLLGWSVTREGAKGAGTGGELYRGRVWAIGPVQSALGQVEGQCRCVVPGAAFHCHLEMKGDVRQRKGLLQGQR